MIIHNLPTAGSGAPGGVLFFVVPDTEPSIKWGVSSAQLGASFSTNVLVRALPEPQNGRFSFADMLSLLDETGRDAFDQQRAVLDLQLRERYANNEISGLNFYRRLARMTQEQLAQRARSRQSFVSQLEQRKRSLTWKQALRFARALGVTAAQLMERE